MSEPSPTDIDLLISLYLDGDIEGVDFRRLDAWLKEDREHVAYFVARVADHCRTSELVSGEFGLPFLSPESERIFQDAFEGENEFPTIQYTASSARSKSQYASALSYVVGHTFTPKRIAMLATAAALLLGVVIAIVLITSGPEEPQPIVNTPEHPGSTDEPINQPVVVATLTAERDAVWDHRPGEDLYAGQRFSLTEGFAEITTHRGAVAILEAPCTIELLDNDNAIRLHSGKLVGICESESSKGLLVRTSHVDIIDLGTRFGVDATEQARTSVQVFDGEVQVVPVDPVTSKHRAMRLTAGQAVTGNGEAVSKAGFDVTSFVDALNVAAGMEDLRPHFEGTPVLWQGVARQDMTLHQQEADALQVYLERQAVVLDKAVHVDTKAGEAWPPERGFGKATISQGSHVDVYLLHLDAIGDKPGHHLRARCVIRFDRPIVGLMGAESSLRATDASLGLPGAAYPSIREKGPVPITGGAAGLDPRPYLDIATISEDGRTLTLDIAAAQSLDQVRVLVKAVAGKPTP